MKEGTRRLNIATTLAASALVLGVSISWPAEASPRRDDCIVGARPSYAPGLAEAETRALRDEVIQVVSDKYFKLDVPPVSFGFGAWIELTDFYLRFGTGCDRRMDNAAAIFAIVEQALSGKVTFDVIADYPPGEIRRVLPTETARPEDMPEPKYERRDCIVAVDAMLLPPTTGDALRARKKRITEFVWQQLIAQRAPVFAFYSGMSDALTPLYFVLRDRCEQRFDYVSAIVSATEAEFGDTLTMTMRRETVEPDIAGFSISAPYWRDGDYWNR